MLNSAKAINTVVVMREHVFLSSIITGQKGRQHGKKLLIADELPVSFFHKESMSSL